MALWQNVLYSNEFIYSFLNKLKYVSCHTLLQYLPSLGCPKAQMWVIHCFTYKRHLRSSYIKKLDIVC